MAIQAFKLLKRSILIHTVGSQGVTAALTPHTIVYVLSGTAQRLTKRRAVDFCRVATAQCRPFTISSLRTRHRIDGWAVAPTS
jgi:hypothetical protein